MRYPLSIHNFGRIRRGGYAYVDKTEAMIRCLDAGAALFLSRPRRFGKSLMISTYKEMYSGSRELFEGLYAGEHWDFEARQRPVIHLGFLGTSIRTNGVEVALHEVLNRECRRLDMEHPPGMAPEVRLTQLITDSAAAHPSGRCVVLIDEYDKLIVDFLHEPGRAREHRDALKTFYGVLKAELEHLEQVILTGVSAFSKVSVFSDLNHLVNLTLHPAAQSIVGITGSELEAHFRERLEEVKPSREAIRRHYNGYSWVGGEAERVYNPWSVLNFLSTGILDDYWFETGTPTWLVRLLIAAGPARLLELERRFFTSVALLSFDLERIDPVAVMFQTGYLTVVEEDGYDEGRTPEYRLDYPNAEVRHAYSRDLVAGYTDVGRGDVGQLISGMARALRRGEIAPVVEQLDAFLAGVPYDLWGEAPYERTFHMMVHLVFTVLDVRVRSEVHTARGRCDALVETDAHVYAFEFKRDKRAAEAIAQIRERGYLAAFSASAKTRHAVGVSFDSAQRRLGEWAAEEVF